MTSENLGGQGLGHHRPSAQQPAGGAYAGLSVGCGDPRKGKYEKSRHNLAYRAQLKYRWFQTFFGKAVASKNSCRRPSKNNWRARRVPGQGGRGIRGMRGSPPPPRQRRQFWISNAEADFLEAKLWPKNADLEPRIRISFTCQILE